VRLGATHGCKCELHDDEDEDVKCRKSAVKEAGEGRESDWRTSEKKEEREMIGRERTLGTRKGRGREESELSKERRKKESKPEEKAIWRRWQR
jgi:hypothetical protein